MSFSQYQILPELAATYFHVNNVTNIISSVKKVFLNE